jgi:hypothetical protein
MLRIDKMTGGRFGNRILHYNTLTQLAKTQKREVSCVSWSTSLPGRARNDGSSALNDGKYHCFENIIPYKESLKERKELGWKSMLSENFSFLSADTDYTIHPYAIHNVFWQVTKNDPAEFFKIEEKYNPSLSPEFVNVGIHLRGGDVIHADGNQGREVHHPYYYRDAIDLVESEYPNTKYHVCTDDRNFKSFAETISYLESQGLNYEIGSSDLFVDFSTLSECDILIASSSTFAICAAFIGKRKKIIHSREWIQKNLNHEPWNNKPTSTETREHQLSFDKFWVDLYNGGNEYYKIWRLV